MLPLRLHMQNFGSFREPATVDFADVEYFALVGPTGPVRAPSSTRSASPSTAPCRGGARRT